MNICSVDARAARNCAISRVALLLLLTMQTGCDKNPSDDTEYFLAQPHISSPAEYLDCAAMANQYVAKEKSWPESDYNVRYEHLDPETHHQVFRISHINSYRGPIGIGGDEFSFFLHVDCATMKIDGEYKQQ